VAPEKSENRAGKKTSPMDYHHVSYLILEDINMVAAPVERPRSFMFFRGRFRGSKHNSL